MEEAAGLDGARGSSDTLVSVRGVADWRMRLIFGSNGQRVAGNVFLLGVLHC